MGPRIAGESAARDDKDYPNRRGASWPGRTRADIGLYVIRRHRAGRMRGLACPHGAAAREKFVDVFFRILLECLPGTDLTPGALDGSFSYQGYRR